MVREIFTPIPTQAGNLYIDTRKISYFFFYAKKTNILLHNNKIIESTLPACELYKLLKLDFLILETKKGIVYFDPKGIDSFLERFSTTEIRLVNGQKLEVNHTINVVFDLIEAFYNNLKPEATPKATKKKTKTLPEPIND